LHIIPPPVDLPACTNEEAFAFYEKHDLGDSPVIGISARLAAEKGVEVLLKALPHILAAFPNARVLHAGPYKDIMGEEAYWQKLKPIFEQYANEYTLLGSLSGAELTAFYKNLDVLVLCSLNSTESFGLVQIEAMSEGVPACASNLPGVRQPVTMTGMGEVVPIGDHEMLAAAVVRVLQNKAAYIKEPDTIAAAFSPAQTAREYLKLYEALKTRTVSNVLAEPTPYGQLRTMRDQLAVTSEQ
jgi:glycosyltransferase involved in cell wall biosynthesis